ncbi:MAG: MFS transporter [Treponema sp.]|jgi:MFS family permease|nr:MFS transporter [Treponema sp.]
MKIPAPQANFRPYLGITLLIGFGFFTMGLMDPLYDTYVPLFLRRYLSSNTAVGALMTLDNLLQIILIPVVAVWSDRTRTRLGRRMPFIVVMLPISALFFSLIPSMAALSLAALIGIIFIFNVFKTAVRGPVVALMPDTVPADYRSEANGIINMMGGFGLLVSTLFLARLMNINGFLSKGFLVQGSLPFGLAGLCILAAVLVLLVFVREKTPGGDGGEKRVPVMASLKQVFSGESKNSVGRILISLFFWFTAYEGIKPFLGLFLVEYVGVDEGSAALAQGAAGISSVILAVPSGYLAHKIGRKRFIRICLAVLAAILVLIPLSGLLTGSLPLTGRLAVFLGLMFFYGIFWIGVVVNSFPMLWQMAGFDTMGVYTGLYYTFSQGAAILAPPVTGAVIDLAGYPGLFIFGGAAMLAAWFIMGGVRLGEAETA